MESSDLVEVYLRPFSTTIKDRIRSFALPVQACIALMGGRFDWTEEQRGTDESEIWSSAVAHFGEEVATIAYGVIKASNELGRPNVETQDAERRYPTTLENATGLQPVPKASGAGQAVPSEGQQEDADLSDAAGQARSAQGSARSSNWNPSLPPGQAAAARVRTPPSGRSHRDAPPPQRARTAADVATPAERQLYSRRNTEMTWRPRGC